MNWWPEAEKFLLVVFPLVIGALLGFFFARATAKQTEIGRIDGRLHKLDEILAELRAVTITQKQIEATIGGREWDRQWALSQKKLGYEGILESFDRVLNHCVSAIGALRNGADPAEVYEKHIALMSSLLAESRKAEIFTDESLSKLVEPFITEALDTGRGTNPDLRYYRDLGFQLGALLTKILGIAKEDFRKGFTGLSSPTG